MPSVIGAERREDQGKCWIPTPVRPMEPLSLKARLFLLCVSLWNPIEGIGKEGARWTGVEDPHNGRHAWGEHGWRNEG